MSRSDIKVREMQFANALLMPKVIKMLNEGHTVTLKLKGRSMRPFLEDDRDKALLKALNGIKVGDPVLAEVSPDKYVLHRVIRIIGDNVTLQGDGNIGIENCRKCDVKGIAIGFYRKGRDIIDSTEDKKWKVYSWIWMRLFPIRRYLLAFYRIVWLQIFPVRLIKK